MPELRFPPEIPRPAWRIGVVGAPEEATAPDLARLLQRAARQLLASRLPGRPLLRLVTTLEGPAGAALVAMAEDLAADPAFAGALDIRLDVILPFAGAGATPDRADGWQAAQGFAARHGAAALAVMTLDGLGADARRQRRAVARMVMRNCDTLAIGCGASIHARTPEAELLRVAARQGPNLLWLRPDGSPPRLLRDTTDLLRAEDLAPAGDAAWQALEAEMAAALARPGPAPDHAHGRLERLVFRLCPGRAAPDAYADFLAERDLPGGGAWGSYGLARGLAARAPGDWRPWALPMVALLALSWLALASLGWRDGAPGGDRAILLLTGLALAALVALALLPRAAARPRPASPGPAAPDPGPGQAPPGPESLAFWRPPLLLLGLLLPVVLLGAVLVRASSGLGEVVMLALILAAIAAVSWLFLLGPLSARDPAARPAPLEARARALLAALAPWAPLAAVAAAGLVAATVLALSPRDMADEPILALTAGAALGMAWIWRRLHPRDADRPDTEEEAAIRASWWGRAYHAPDRLSVAYGDRYRSACVLVILLIALALVFAVLGLVFATDPAAKGAKLAVLVAEALALAGIVGLVAATVAGRWHRKWVGYRLLAELCRKQEALARLGWSLPVYDVRGAAEAGVPDGAWIAWHFNALLRAAPLPTPDLGAVQNKEAIRAEILGRPGPGPDHRRGLVQGQLDYHRGRAGRSAAAAAAWASWGEVAFLGTAACVAAKLLLKLFGAAPGWEIWLAAGAAGLPAVSAAFFALRASLEERLMAEQSARMEADLAAAKRAIAAIPLDRPLASQDLAAETFEVAQRMLADVGGWAQLVRVKVVEAA